MALLSHRTFQGLEITFQELRSKARPLDRQIFLLHALEENAPALLLNKFYLTLKEEIIFRLPKSLSERRGEGNIYHVILWGQKTCDIK